MQKASIFRGIFALVCATALAIPAFADIKAFNAAVKAGDYKKAAAEAKTSWETWDKSDPDTATVAREFGFAAYMGGDFVAARDFGQFLKEKGATLAKPDDQPATSSVLFAAASFRIGKNEQSRNALADALKAREGSPGLDTMSLVASEALYRSDWSEGQFSRARDSASLAYRLMSRGGEVLAPRALEARSNSAAAGFLAGRDRKDYDAMMDTHDAIVDAIDAATDPKRRAALVTQKFKAEAWATSVWLYFKSSQQIGSNIPKSFKERDFKKPKEGLFLQTGTPLASPSCPAKIDADTIDYPTSAIFRGMIGTVILKYDSDEQGRITKAEVLAAVPGADFAEEISENISEIRLVQTGTIPGCTMARQANVITFTFRIA